MRIAALAIQGNFESHLAAALRAFPGSSSIEIRHARDIPPDGVDLFLLPGGESGAMSLLFDYNELWDPVRKLIQRKGTVTLATCAGAIITAQEVINPGKARTLGLVDIAIERNAYGRQIDSFIGRLEPSPSFAGQDAAFGRSPAPEGLEAVFIRAPIIRRVGKGVEVLASVRWEPVLVRQGTILSATFHPEKAENSAVYSVIGAMLAQRA